MGTKNDELKPFWPWEGWRKAGGWYLSDQQHQNFSPESRHSDSGSRGRSLSCGASPFEGPARSSHQQARRRMQRKRRTRRELGIVEGGSGQFQSWSQPLLLPFRRAPALRQERQRHSAAACKGCTCAPRSTSSYTPAGRNTQSCKGVLFNQNTPGSHSADYLIYSLMKMSSTSDHLKLYLTSLLSSPNTNLSFK